MMVFILTTDFDFVAYMSKMAFFWKLFSRQWRFWNMILYMHMERESRRCTSLPLLHSLWPDMPIYPLLSHTHTHTHTHRHTHILSLSHIHTHTHVCTHTHPLTHTYTLTLTWKHTRACAYTYTLTSKENARRANAKMIHIRHTGLLQSSPIHIQPS